MTARCEAKSGAPPPLHMHAPTRRRAWRRRAAIGKGRGACVLHHPLSHCQGGARPASLSQTSQPASSSRQGERLKRRAGRSLFPQARPGNKTF